MPRDANRDDSVSLREYVEALLLEHQRALAIKEKADERALELAKRAQDHRDEQANELRQQIAEERGRYVTQEQLGAFRNAYEAAHRPLQDFVTAQLAQQATRAEGKTGLRSNIATITAVVGAIIATALLILGYVNYQDTSHGLNTPTVTVTVPAAIPEP